eukprot:CAMPEP_0185527130 /NCGR_PEP_ID=MMETSP1366-20130426/95189_1 /TAXON_ID=38817 /ORGANISM="Gephyrocapsa oceanica, Strain RCC1303" /LENGTH=70 /DNA_ID=CAMNT_0028138611 /DNA_START=25 /DNA_END=233 /DNA_ORIENTATION=-
MPSSRPDAGVFSTQVCHQLPHARAGGDGDGDHLLADNLLAFGQTLVEYEQCLSPSPPSPPSPGGGGGGGG